MIPYNIRSPIVPAEEYFRVYVKCDKRDKRDSEKDDEPLGLVLMLGSLALFSVTMLLNRVIYYSMYCDSVNIFMYSSVVQVITSEFLRRVVYREYMDEFLSSSRAKKLICVRYLFSVAGWVALTYLASVLPIGYIQLNYNAIPVVTAFLAYFILGERVTGIEIVSLLICFAVITATGVAKLHSQASDYSLANILLCLMSVVAFGAINVISRSLKGWHFSVLCTAYFTLNFVFSLLLLLVMSEEFYVLQSVYDVMMMVFLGLSRSFSTLLFVKACQLCQSQRLATLNYTQSVMGYTIDMLVYDYVLQGIEVFSVLVVLVAGAITFIYSHLHKQKQKNSDELIYPLLEGVTSSSPRSVSGKNKDWPGLKYKVLY